MKKPAPKAKTIRVKPASSPRPKNRRVQIGVVGVDSGQILICDPCYINSQWKRNESPCVWNIYLDTKTKKRWTCALHNPICIGADATFETFGTPVSSAGNLTPNELIARGLWVKQPRPEPTGEFSYRGCCQATLSDRGAGQLIYELGHAGVAFRSGYGDGVYPVYATYNEDGRIIKVEVEMS